MIRSIPQQQNSHAAACFKFTLPFQRQPLVKQNPEEYADRLRCEAEEALRSSGVQGSVSIYHVPRSIEEINRLGHGSHARRCETFASNAGSPAPSPPTTPIVAKVEATASSTVINDGDNAILNIEDPGHRPLTQGGNAINFNGFPSQAILEIPTHYPSPRCFKSINVVTQLKNTKNGLSRVTPITTIQYPFPQRTISTNVDALPKNANDIQPKFARITPIERPRNLNNVLENFDFGFAALARDALFITKTMGTLSNVVDNIGAHNAIADAFEPNNAINLAAVRMDEFIDKDLAIIREKLSELHNAADKIKSNPALVLAPYPIPLRTSASAGSNTSISSSPNCSNTSNFTKNDRTPSLSPAPAVPTNRIGPTKAPSDLIPQQENEDIKPLISVFNGSNLANAIAIDDTIVDIDSNSGTDTRNKPTTRRHLSASARSPVRCNRSKPWKISLDKQIEREEVIAEVMEAAEMAGIDVAEELAPRRSRRTKRNGNVENPTPFHAVGTLARRRIKDIKKKEEEKKEEEAAEAVILKRKNLTVAEKNKRVEERAKVRALAKQKAAEVVVAEKHTHKPMSTEAPTERARIRAEVIEAAKAAGVAIVELEPRRSGRLTRRIDSGNGDSIADGASQRIEIEKNCGNIRAAKFADARNTEEEDLFELRKLINKMKKRRIEELSNNGNTKGKGKALFEIRVPAPPRTGYIKYKGKVPIRIPAEIIDTEPEPSTPPRPASFNSNTIETSAQAAPSKKPRGRTYNTTEEKAQTKYAWLEVLRGGKKAAQVEITVRAPIKKGKRKTAISKKGKEKVTVFEVSRSKSLDPFNIGGVIDLTTETKEAVAKDMNKQPQEPTLAVKSSQLLLIPAIQRFEKTRKNSAIFAGRERTKTPEIEPAEVSESVVKLHETQVQEQAHRLTLAPKPPTQPKVIRITEEAAHKALDKAKEKVPQEPTPATTPVQLKSIEFLAGEFGIRANEGSVTLTEVLKSVESPSSANLLGKKPKTPAPMEVAAEKVHPITADNGKEKQIIPTVMGPIGPIELAIRASLLKARNLATKTGETSTVSIAIPAQEKTQEPTPATTPTNSQIVDITVLEVQKTLDKGKAGRPSTAAVISGTPSTSANTPTPRSSRTFTKGAIIDETKVIEIPDSDFEPKVSKATMKVKAPAHPPPRNSTKAAARERVICEASSSSATNIDPKSLNVSKKRKVATHNDSPSPTEKKSNKTQVLAKAVACKDQVVDFKSPENVRRTRRQRKVPVRYGYA